MKYMISNPTWIVLSVCYFVRQSVCVEITDAASGLGGSSSATDEPFCWSHQALCLMEQMEQTACCPTPQVKRNRSESPHVP